VTKSDKRDGVPLYRDAKKAQPDDASRRRKAKRNKSDSLRYRHDGKYRFLWLPKYNHQRGGCWRKPTYNERYDAHYCAGCLVWLEEKCGKKDCATCKGRTTVQKALEENK